jgi:RNA polymerase sigma-70 factor, ECF subfamily
VIPKPIAFQEPGLAIPEDTLARESRFAALVHRQSRFVFRIAYTVVRNTHDAEDVVQETFLKLYSSGAWEQMNDERAFLARTSWRVAVDKLRRNRSAAMEMDPPSGAPSPLESLIRSDRDAIVHRLLDGLPEELRQTLALSTVEELNSRQIAEVMGISEGTVRTRLMRARQILKQKLSALMEGRHESK